MRARVTVPDLARQRALAHGAVGRRWLADLPEVVAGLAARWDLELGAAYEGGTAAYVVRATERGERPCVLKVAMALDEEDAVAFARSVRVHRLAGGEGCATLLDVDASTSAMLLERLGPNLADLRLPLPQLFEAVVATLRSFWRPVGADVDLPTGAEKAEWLARFTTRTWDELGRPCGRDVIDRAVTSCERRAAAFDATTAVLVHGDAHGWNTLDAGGGSYKLVDPEGVRSEPAHDLSVPMREYNGPLLAGDTSHLVRERAAHLAARCGVDADAVWEWGFIERVSTGLSSLRSFDGDDGMAFLEVARRCL